MKTDGDPVPHINRRRQEKQGDEDVEGLDFELFLDQH
jgi:hypothetical protein